MMIRKYMLIWGLLFLLLIPFSSVAEESGNWTLSYKGNPIQAELLDVTADNTDHFRSGSMQQIHLTFWSPKKYDRFLFGFVNVPNQLDVYAITSETESRLLVSIEPEVDMFTIDLPPYQEETLQFICLYKRRQACAIDQFLPLRSSETLPLPHVAADSEAKAMIILPTASIEDKLLSRLQEMLLDCPDATIAVLAKAKTIQRHRFMLTLWQRGIRWDTLFGDFSAPKEALTVRTQLKQWGQEKLDRFISEAIRARKPLYLLYPAGETTTATALEIAATQAREVSMYTSWDRDTAAKNGLWHVPFLLSFPFNEPLPSITRQEAKEQTKQILIASIEDNLASEAVDLSTYGIVAAPAFPSEGETVIEDKENGAWIYQSRGLSVVIRQHQAKTKNMIWLEADIRVNLNSEERLGIVRIGEDPMVPKHYSIQRILSASQNVFAINSDYHMYRDKRNWDTGVIIRERQVIYPGGIGIKKGVFPPLDTFVFFEDGSLKTFFAKEYSAQEYLDMGAVHVFSFGPSLVREGELCFPNFRSITYKAARCGLGMIEPGHYLAILIECDTPKSYGGSFDDLANLFIARGCKEAFNLDGGNTAEMCFMGKRLLSHIKKGEERSMSELIGVGTSQLVPGLNDGS